LEPACAARGKGHAVEPSFTPLGCTRSCQARTRLGYLGADVRVPARFAGKLEVPAPSRRATTDGQQIHKNGRAKATPAPGGRGRPSRADCVPRLGQIACAGPGSGAARRVRSRAGGSVATCPRPGRFLRFPGRPRANRGAAGRPLSALVVDIAKGCALQALRRLKANVCAGSRPGTRIISHFRRRSDMIEPRVCLSQSTTTDRSIMSAKDHQSCFAVVAVVDARSGERVLPGPWEARASERPKTCLVALSRRAREGRCCLNAGDTAQGCADRTVRQSPYRQVPVGRSSRRRSKCRRWPARAV
jgi:hypothetical protein